jgi:molecular chaperone GrpE
MVTKQSNVKKKDSNLKKIDSLQKEIDALKATLKEKEDKLLRSIADFQNYQKRIEKELICCREDAKKKYLQELIDLNELLKKAYEDNNPKQGLKLLLNNIENFFEKEQIKYIDCKGKKFDHNIHHAVSTIEKNDCESNIIIEEIKKGYMINDKLLRPSHVIVSKNKDK